MRRFRIITALFLALLWVPSVGHCLLAANFPNVFTDFCECDGDATGGSEVPESVPVWSPPPTRTVTLTKAQPVRGPSLAA